MHDAEPSGLTQPLYAQIAQQLARLIDAKVFRPGKKLPSVRDIALSHGVSAATAVQALRWLEERHLVFAKPRAGYFVSSNTRAPALPSVSNPSKHSLVVDRRSRVEALAALNDEPIVSFGGACPKDPHFFDEERIRTALLQSARKHRMSLVEYTDLQGTPELCSAAAQRALHLGCQLSADDIVITASCIHAVGLCLRAVAAPGDVVAIESPTHFGFLDLLESLNLRALEIPTHPKEGVSLDALRLALDTQPVKAVLSVPTLSNPLGAVMSNLNKRRLVQMLAEQGIPLIEDVVFNDLLASDERRRAAKSYDAHGNVMICGSFSKTLTPGIRLGWMEAGRWKDSVKRLKRIQGVPTNHVLECALADLVTQPGYEARMRKFSEFLQNRLEEARTLIAQSFPKGTRISAPPTGLTLWLELPEDINTTQLFEKCRQEGIILGPGSLFTAGHRFNHCLRLSFAGLWGEKEKGALLRIGELARTI
jgi:DNA-binding transcriptional MocR family regulator